MCFDSNSSITSYFIGTVFSTISFIITKNKYIKQLCIFIFAFTQIQILEYIIWKDQKCSGMNQTASSLLLPFLYFQPIALFTSGYFFNNFIFPNYICIFFSIFFSYLAIESYINSDKSFCSKPSNKSGHLIWPTLNYELSKFKEVKLKLYISSILLPFLFLKNEFLGINSFLFGVFGLLYTRHYISYKKNNNISFIELFQGWESKWCYISVYFSIIVFGLTFIY